MIETEIRRIKSFVCLGRGNQKLLAHRAGITPEALRGCRPRRSGSELPAFNPQAKTLERLILALDSLILQGHEAAQGLGIPAFWPAANIANLCGGIDRLADFAEVDGSIAKNWVSGLTGDVPGLIPSVRIPIIIQAASSNGIELSEAQFFERAGEPFASASSQENQSKRP